MLIAGGFFIDALIFYLNFLQWFGHIRPARTAVNSKLKRTNNGGLLQRLPYFFAHGLIYTQIRACKVKIILFLIRLNDIYLRLNVFLVAKVFRQLFLCGKINNFLINGCYNAI